MTSLQAESVLQRSPPEKEGRGTDPVIAVFTQCIQSWRRRTEAESANCETTSPDGKLLKHPTKGTCGAGDTPLLKLHYQIR